MKAVADSLWSSELMAFTIVTLKDRLKQAADLVGKINTVMMGIFCSIYLANTSPSSIFMLADFFSCSVGRLVNFTLEQL